MTNVAWQDAVKAAGQGAEDSNEAQRRGRQGRRSGRNKLEGMETAPGASKRRRGQEKTDKTGTTKVKGRKKALGAEQFKPAKTLSSSLALEAMIENVTFTKNSVMVWFNVRSKSLSFSPVQDIEAAIRADAVTFGKLAGRKLHLRGTTRPYQVKQWAQDTRDEAYALSTNKPVGPTKDYTPDQGPIKSTGGVDAMLNREQIHLSTAAFSEKWVYLGIQLATKRKHPDARRELLFHKEEIDELTRSFARSSLSLSPASRADMEWLLRRSLQLGLQVGRIGTSADYEASDIPELVAAADWTSEPGDKHLLVTGVPAGSAEAQSAFVSVLSLGRLADQAIPEQYRSGWMQRSDRAGFPVEWSAIIEVIAANKTEGWLQGVTAKISDQVSHYRDEHGLEAPRSLARQAAMASQIQDEVTTDQTGSSLRTRGWYRVAVAGTTVQELNQRIEALRAVYGSSAELVQSSGQYGYAREFIPGEPLANTGFERRMSVKTLAAAIPHGTASIGDRTGTIIGYTSGAATRAVAWHTHWDMERRDRSGLMIIVGGLGSGKSFLMGGLIYRSAMTGVVWSVFDPSDRLGRLCDPEMVPELAGRTRYVNLMNGRDGELNPFRVVAEPKEDHFVYVDESTGAPMLDVRSFREAQMNARSTRISLLKDLIKSMIEPKLWGSETVQTILTGVWSQIDASPTANPAQILEVLGQIVDGTHRDSKILDRAHRVAAHALSLGIQEKVNTPIGRLIFPPASAAALAEEESREDTVLTVYTLNGMPIPSEEDIASGNLSDPDRMALAVLTMAAFLVQSSIYRGNFNARKGLAIDEGKVLNSFSAGKALITKVSTDSRKFNVRAILSSQNAAHFNFNGDDPDALGNLLSAAMVGQTTEAAAQKAGLNLLGVPTGMGYEPILASLRPQQSHKQEVLRDEHGQLSVSQEHAEQNDKRDFIFSVVDDVTGNSQGRSIERITFDLDAHPHVAKALATSPSPYTPATSEPSHARH
ncbi:MAG: ATP-binding protein [Arthrobacter sp.]|jgi:hypothetical protein|nr:ATP-binding protein [Arthrobacter sp.]